MADLSKAKWDLSKEERYAISWLEEHGFMVTLEKQFVSKTKFTVTKEGITDHLDLPQGVKGFDIKKYMVQYEKSFIMLRELQSLRKQAGTE